MSRSLFLVPALRIPGGPGFLFLAALWLAAFFPFAGCTGDPPTGAAKGEDLQPFLFETTGEEFLVSALDEVERLADLAGHAGIGASLPAKPGKALISATEADTAYIYGEVTPGGYGAVVTERHTYPKGLLLITVRRSYGTSPSRMVTETKRYISYQDFLDDAPQQSNITEVYGLSADTLVTHVTRNGTVETYTFRLPVVTRTTNPADGSVRVTTRYGFAGTVRSELRDGNGTFTQLRTTYGDSTGALTTYTLYADSSWRNVRSVGEADGTVLHDVTSGP